MVDINTKHQTTPQWTLLSSKGQREGWKGRKGGSDFETAKTQRWCASQMAPWLLRFMEAGYHPIHVWGVGFSALSQRKQKTHGKNTIKPSSQASPSELNQNQLRWLWSNVAILSCWKLRILHCNRNVLKDSMVSSASFEVRRLKRDVGYRISWFERIGVMWQPLFCSVCRVLSWVALGWGFVFLPGS